eukprot:TRINITY_DN415_c0_g1_i1.p1 TRINITY_DN415_c0_g1~~TRINITY_DN415_c0_g1_i1.p1  ORF type:complete len:261 (+),score=116.82 TRINITY_DN415_c0_g1_i1:102-785(+)
MAKSTREHPHTLGKHPALYPYLMEHSRESDEMRRLRVDVVEKHGRGVMSAAPDESMFLSWLVKTSRFKRVIEVGTFLGYTTMAVAQALPEDGKIITLDVSEEFTTTAREHWKMAGVADKIELRLSPGVESMRALLKEYGENSFDMVFIDADKPSYDDYYELGMKLVRPGGVVAVDNTLWGGEVLKAAAEHSDSTKAIDQINKKMKADERVEMCVLGIADGVTLCTKK